MGSLNPRWLSIELDSIDATMEKWIPALWASYQASLQTLAGDDIARNYLDQADRRLEEISALL